ncbi:MAG: helix-turn-helix domain-containing protein [Lachnospiraceae bacterium]
MQEAQKTAIRMTLEFFHRIGLNASVQQADAEITPEIDLGIRQHLMSGNLPFRISSLLTSRGEGESGPEDSPLVISEDRFACRYLIARLPRERQSTPEIFLPEGIHVPVDPGAYEGITAGGKNGPAPLSMVLVAGPYLTSPMRLSFIREQIRKYGLPESLLTYFAQYYSTLLIEPQAEFFAPYLLSLGHALYGNRDLEIFRRVPPTTPGQDLQDAGGISEMEFPDETRDLLQLRYDKEEEMMNYIAEGNTDAAVQIENGPYFHSLESRTTNAIRDRKNKLVILNTLCRKGAQRAGIHPVYLDEMSRRMSVKIENAATMAELERIPREMIRKYCFLVQSLDTRMFSPTIRKAVNYIDAHYQDPGLSLSSMAEAFQMNKSYLASTFRKETGTTVTTYLNTLRINRACLRLNTTADPIGDIAAGVGIPNVNYFTRLFRKQKNLTPTAYRQQIRS